MSRDFRSYLICCAAFAKIQMLLKFTMTDPLRSIFDFVIWIFVPLVLVMIIRYVSGVHKRVGDPRYSGSAKAGFWAGFILFIMVLIYQVGIFIATSFPHNKLYQGFDLVVALGGAVLGFLLFIGGRKASPQKIVGWVVLIVAFCAFYALLHYLFIRTYNKVLLSLILGMTFGALAHSASSPAALKEFIRPSSSSDDSDALL